MFVFHLIMLFTNWCVSYWAYMQTWKSVKLVERKSINHSGLNQRGWINPMSISIPPKWKIANETNNRIKASANDEFSKWSALRNGKSLEIFKLKVKYRLIIRWSGKQWKKYILLILCFHRRSFQLLANEFVLGLVFEFYSRLLDEHNCTCCFCLQIFIAFITFLSLSAPIPLILRWWKSQFDRNVAIDIQKKKSAKNEIHTNDKRNHIFCSKNARCEWRPTKSQTDKQIKSVSEFMR